MLSSVLLQSVSQLSMAEKIDLLNYLDTSLSSQEPRWTRKQIAAVQGRAADLDADPTLALPWEGLNAELEAEFG
jgi:putative addiction module component (TIGR02574 family)